jgi:predicted membrane protein
MKHLALIGVAIFTPLIICLTMAAIYLPGNSFSSVSLSPHLLDSVLARGATRVLVRLNTPYMSEGRLRPGGVILQRNMIRYAQEQVISALDEIPDTEVIYQYNNTPLLAIFISGESLLILQNLGGLVLRIDEQCAYLDAALCDFNNRGG